MYHRYVVVLRNIYDQFFPPGGPIEVANPGDIWDSNDPAYDTFNTYHFEKRMRFTTSFFPPRARIEVANPGDIWDSESII